MDDDELHELADRYFEAHRRGKAPPLHEVMAAAGDDGDRLADLIELRLALGERPLLDNEADLDAVAAVMGGLMVHSTDGQPADNVVVLNVFRSVRHRLAAAAKTGKGVAAAARKSTAATAAKRLEEAEYTAQQPDTKLRGRSRLASRLRDILSRSGKTP